jgi:hypothetical protein
MNTGSMFARVFAADYVIMGSKKIVKETFGHKTDGKNYQ